MADNFIVKDGNQNLVTLGSDDVSSVQYPRHKVVWGADGAVNDTSASNPLPITGTVTASPTGTYTVAGTTTAVPTGTQAVSGTVTASPTGTYTVAGTTTAVPSGAYTVAGTTTAVPSGVYTVAQGTATNLKAQIIGAGTAGTADTNVVTVQGIAAGTALTVAGTTTAVPSGTYTVTGTTTASPTGTYTVAGTVTASPTGTYTVAGTTTAVPSGVYTVAQGTATNLKAQVIGAGTAGSADANVVTVQGIASGTALTVAGTTTASPTGTYTVAGTTTASPTGTYTVAGTVTAVPSGTYTITSANEDTLVGGLVGTEYETVAASQTAQALGATGATGDLITGVLVIPATTSPGNVLLLDNATSITVFAGGASSVSNLVPFLIPLGLKSLSGAWKITTGSNVSCIGMGNFT